MRDLFRATIVTHFAVALLCCVGCGSFQNGFDRLFSSNYHSARGGDDPYPQFAEFDRDVTVVDYEEAVDNEGIRVQDLAPENLGRTVKKLTGNGPNRESAKKIFIEAERDYQAAANRRRQGQDSAEAFIAAAEKYSEAAKRWPSSSLEQDSLFRAGECYFFADHYPEANEAFVTLIKKYPNTDYLDRAEAMRFSLAKFWLDLDKEDPQNFFSYNFMDQRRPTRGTFSRAVSVFDQIRMDDPTGKLADDATLAAGNAHFERGDFYSAAEFYDDLRQTFPSSEHQFHAHFLGLKSKMKTYPGKEYDGKTLDQAEDLLKQIRKQFPHDAEREREYLAQVGAEIRYRKAERDWKNARYYDWRGEHRAARFYYHNILDEYPDTPFAAQARERIAAIAGKPDVPPQRLGWLVKLFPEKNSSPAFESPIPTGDQP